MHNYTKAFNLPEKKRCAYLFVLFAWVCPFKQEINLLHGQVTGHSKGNHPFVPSSCVPWQMLLLFLQCPWWHSLGTVTPSQADIASLGSSPGSGGPHGARGSCQALSLGDIQRKANGTQLQHRD